MSRADLTVLIARVIAPGLCVAAGSLGCPDAGACVTCKKDSAAISYRILAALDAAGLEVRPKQMDREKTLRRWVQATAKEGER
jgi:hypothetical protein